MRRRAPTIAELNAYSIFPVSEQRSRGAACRDAYAAASAANAAIAARGLDFRRVIGVQVGAFQYGNIGSLRRMDFTVIGNESEHRLAHRRPRSSAAAPAARALALVAAGKIPAHCRVRTALKGIDGEVELFVPAAD